MMEYKDWIFFSLGCVGFVVTMIGWSINSIKNRKMLESQHKFDRKLQQKQLAIEILLAERFEQSWIESRTVVYSAFRNSNTPDWLELMKIYIDPEKDLDESQKKYFYSLLEVLNFFEFISIAILNEAVDEKIFKWCMKGHFKRINKECLTFFAEIKSSQPTAFCNYFKVCEKWFPNNLEEEVAKRT